MWYMKELFEVTDVDAAAHLGERREYHGCRCQESGGLFLLVQGEAEDIRELFPIYYISIFKGLGKFRFC